MSDQPAVIMVAQAAYHLEELLPLAAALERHGEPSIIVAPVPTSRVLSRWRPANKRHQELLAVSPNPSGPVLSQQQLARARALVVLNDWGTTASLVKKMKTQSVPTFAWVEGVQDFADLDTGKQRKAYRSVDHVFCLGQYDYQALAGTSRTVVGSERLRALWFENPTSVQSDRLLVNLNFTYGVGEQHRGPWLKSVQKSMQAADWKYVISQHVADKSLVAPWRKSSDSSSVLLAGTPLFVTRFSTLGYEALVRGIPMIYHNPHGEQVPTFADPRGAFAIAESVEELIRALKADLPTRTKVRQQAEEFLNHHLHLVNDGSPAEHVADRICAVLVS
ncbi:MAG: hypothetical protein OSA06_09625 [Acidimicrobiales bacterium]|nr:hypothetical protein [Acidimicrobiales bacterium]